MAGQKLYPRATVRKIVKAHSNRNVSKNADVMVCITHALDRIHCDADAWIPDLPGLHAIYADVRIRLEQANSALLTNLHLFSLIKEAAIEAKKGGERGVTARSVKKVTAVCSILPSQVKSPAEA
jgi:hypothetical protein